MLSYRRNTKKIQLKDGLKISSIAFKLFFFQYCREDSIPLIDNKIMYNNIRKAYYGGRTEVFKPNGINLNYYDVNSLYPFVAKQVMPGVKCSYIIDNDIDLDKVFGYLYCDITAPSNIYLGLLPMIHKKGLIFPTGT
jgi:hypothetical protein